MHLMVATLEPSHRYVSHCSSWTFRSRAAPRSTILFVPRSLANGTAYYATASPAPGATHAYSDRKKVVIVGGADIFPVKAREIAAQLFTAVRNSCARCRQIMEVMRRLCMQHQQCPATPPLMPTMNSNSSRTAATQSRQR